MMGKKWCIAWLGWSIIFTVIAFYNMVTGNNPFWQAGCLTIQSGCSLFWLHSLAKLETKKEESKKINNE